MFKKLFLVLLLVSFFSQNLISSHITEGKSKKLRFYLRNDFNSDDPRFKDKPIFGRFKQTYVPPEDLKEVPKQTVILTEAGFELVNISPGNNAQSETWMAINPKDPMNLIATANDNNYMYGDYKMSSWASTDGGRTWSHANTPANRGLLIDKIAGKSMTIFDPGLVYDTDGTAYYVYGFTQINDNINQADDNGVFIAKSTDKGLSWQGKFNGDPISVIAIEQGNQKGQPFHDRYSMASDVNPTSPYKDRLYVAWQKFQAGSNAVVLSYSSDKGVNWSNQIPLFNGDNTQSPYPAVGPDGEVYVTWQYRNTTNHTTQAVVRTSQNGGASWALSNVGMQVFTVGEIDPIVNTSRYIMKDKQNIRVSSVPSIAVDCTPQGSPTRGNAYLVVPGREAPNGDYGIYLSISKDKGNSWSEKKRIDDAITRNDMMFPSIAVDKTNGTVAVFYYSSQNDLNNKGVDAYIAVSRDGGATFNNIRLTPESIYINSPVCVSQQDIMGSNVYWGDYSSIVADNGKIYPLFWWPTGSSYQYGTLDLFTALISSAPKPPTNFKAISQMASDAVKVKLTWTNPTQDMLGGNLTDYTLHIFRDGNEIVTLPAGTAEYIDGTVTDGQSYFYQLRTETPNGDKSPFLDATIFAGGSEKPAPPTLPLAKPAEDGVVLYWTNPSTSVDGSDIRDLVKINVYSEGVIIATAEAGNITPGEQVVLPITLPIEKFYKFKLKAVTKRNNIETLSDFSDEFFSYAGAVRAQLAENFDEPQNRIPTYIISGEWGLSTLKAASAPNSLNQSPGKNYLPNTNSEIIFAPVAISANTKTLNFNYIAKIHTTDFGHVYISNDFGRSFTEIMRFNNNSNDKFQGTIDQVTFDNISYNLTKYIGDTLYIKFTLEAGPFLEDVGLFIDDIVLDNRVGVEERYNPIYKSLTAAVLPNPTLNASILSLSLPISGNLQVDLYDVLGNKINNIANQFAAPGQMDFKMDLGNASAGVYFVRINLNGFLKTIPVIKQ